MAYMEFKTNQERQDFWLSDDGIELIKQWKTRGNRKPRDCYQIYGC